MAANAELLTTLKIIFENLSPISNNPQSATLKHERNPNTVNRIPLFID
jgi:hypothetical protein